MVLMEHWLLEGLPLQVLVWHWWILWQHSRQVGPEHVWVVQERAEVEVVVKHINWSVGHKTSSCSSGDCEHAEPVSDEDSSVEVLNWQFSNKQQTQYDSHLCLRCAVGPVPVRFVRWSGHKLVERHFKPRSKDVDVFVRFCSPLGGPLLHFVR